LNETVQMDWKMAHLAKPWSPQETRATEPI
jgi:hypothetical protein